MKLRVLHDLVFVRPDAQPDQTESGLHIVYDRQRSTMRGTVVALGDGIPAEKGDKRLPHIVAVGDSVIFSPDAGGELQFEKDVIVALSESSILAVITE